MENSRVSAPRNDFNHQFLHILRAASLAHFTRQKYMHVVEDYLAHSGEFTNQEALTAYADTLSRSRRGHLKSAIRKCVERMVTAVKGQATPDNINSIQATLLRFEALQDTIQVSNVYP